VAVGRGRAQWIALQPPLDSPAIHFWLFSLQPDEHAGLDSLQGSPAIHLTQGNWQTEDRGATLSAMNSIHLLCIFCRGFLASQAALAVENLALRQQLAVLKRTTPRPKLRRRDRVFWVCLAKLWSGWRSALVIVSPATVVRWHRQGFKYYWRWKTRGDVGRPPIPPEVQRLIRRLSKENPLWGAPRIRAELALLGHEVADSTVAKYMIRAPKPPSQS